MGNHTDKFPLVPEFGKGKKRPLQHLKVQRSKAFIKKHRIDLKRLAGSPAAHSGEAEREGEAHKERLTAGEVGR